MQKAFNPKACQPTGPQECGLGRIRLCPSSYFVSAVKMITIPGMIITAFPAANARISGTTIYCNSGSISTS
eukprot:scaffold26233_cov22-Prasinocladus_malaysianus.AAC.1